MRVALQCASNPLQSTHIAPLPAKDATLLSACQQQVQQEEQHRGANFGANHAALRQHCMLMQVFFVVFLSRGLLEELVFRVMVLPHPAVDGPTQPVNFAVR